MKRIQVIPRQGNFCKVLTAVEFSDQIGYVKEVTSDEITVQFAGNRIGKYNIEKNTFVEIGSGWFVGNPTIDEKIKIFQEIDLQVMAKIGANTPDMLPGDHNTDRTSIRKDMKFERMREGIFVESDLEKDE